jgi:hypothetical protein
MKKPRKRVDRHRVAYVRSFEKERGPVDPRFTARLEKLFTSKASKAARLARSRADCQEALTSSFAAIARVTRHTAGLPPSKARKPLTAKTLADHEERIRAIENTLFGKLHSSQTRQWLLEGIDQTAHVASSKPPNAKTLARRALGSFLDDWEAKHGALNPEELARARVELQHRPVAKATRSRSRPPPSKAS